MEKAQEDVCAVCGGLKKPGTTTFTAELGFGVVVVRRVPAAVCSQCGADRIADHIAKRIETIMEGARKKNSQVEVTAFS